VAIVPELPEVETVRRGLSRLVIGRRILRVETYNEKSFQASAGDIAAFVIGATIRDVRRRAKVLIIDLDTDYSLVIHLKMTGQMVFRGAENWGAGHPTDSFLGNLPDRSTRVEFELSPPPNRHPKACSKILGSDFETAGKARLSGSDWATPDVKLFFNDQRKFGWIRLVPTAAIAEMDFIKKLGPEPLTGDPFDEFLHRVRRRNGSVVKAAILDQSVVAGIGNIYADESLWAAQVHPATRVRDLSDHKLRKILAAAISVMTLAIEKGGSTDRNYVNAKGEKGSYLAFANVFRRDGQHCPRCGAIIEKIRVAGRGTHVCLECQKMPNILS
jgi:formamidopyrimidine-DNA glycosylase